MTNLYSFIIIYNDLKFFIVTQSYSFMEKNLNSQNPKQNS